MSELCKKAGGGHTGRAVWRQRGNGQRRDSKRTVRRRAGHFRGSRRRAAVLLVCQHRGISLLRLALLPSFLPSFSPLRFEARTSNRKSVRSERREKERIEITESHGSQAKELSLACSCSSFYSSSSSYTHLGLGAVVERNETVEARRVVVASLSCHVVDLLLAFLYHFLYWAEGQITSLLLDFSQITY